MQDGGIRERRDVYNNWPFYSIVDKKIKRFNFTLLFSYKSFWNFDKKSGCNNILKTWKMTFQAFDAKGRQFLNLLYNNLHPINLHTPKKVYKLSTLST